MKTQQENTRMFPRKDEPHTGVSRVHVSGREDYELEEDGKNTSGKEARELEEDGKERVGTKRERAGNTRRSY